MQKYIFERRGRENFAEVAKKKQPNFGFLFCVFCVTFASSAFKRIFSLNAKAAS
jgi:uncharacterized membrane protein YjjP (DUF1212 family)